MVPVRVLRPLRGRDPYSGPSPCLQRGGRPDPFRRRFPAGGLPGRRHLERPPGLDARVLLRRRALTLRGPPPGGPRRAAPPPPPLPGAKTPTLSPRQQPPPGFLC